MTDLQDMFMPHGQCFLWQPGVLWLNVGSDVIIMAAYYIISASLFYFLYKRTDAPVRWMFVLFGLFIFACGTTHLMGAWTVWKPDYWTDGAIKAVTATLSFSTAILLVPVLPKAMALRSPVELEQLNGVLTAALAQREEALRRLEHSRSQLLRRTEELTQHQEQVRQMASQLTTTEQRERRRLATELHDHLQQTLVLGKLKLGQGKQAARSVPGCAQLIHETDELLSEALKYTRTLVAELSPPALRDHGLPAGLKWLGEYMKKHDLTVTVAAPDDVAVKLPEDQAMLLFQSVRELLINVAKYAGTRQAWVTMTEGEGRLSIEVKDEGAGFDPGAAAAGAEPSGGLSSKFGLLSIQERMKALGGSFEIESAPGKGTTATLVSPLRDDVRDKASGVRSGEAASGVVSRLTPYASRVRVLSVDDHAMVRQGLRSVLDSYSDVEVVGEASNGEDAVATVEQLRPQVVVMDINMPTMNGIEATSRIKARHPETIVIGLSVNADGENRQAMTVAGAATLLTKEAAVDLLYEFHPTGSAPRRGGCRLALKDGEMQGVGRPVSRMCAAVAMPRAMCSLRQINPR